MVFVLTAMLYGITYMNSHKYANIILATVVLSLIIGKIEAIQMFSLLGIVVVIVVMIKSASVRKKDIETWFAEKGFRQIEVPYTASLFNHQLFGTNIYSIYQAEMEKIPFQLAIQYNSNRSNNTPSIVFYCSFYFQNGIDLDKFEQKIKQLKDQTPNTNWLKSQFGFFNLKACEIFRPPIGGVVICWRVPDTVSGYNERYEWVKNAIISNRQEILTM